VKNPASWPSARHHCPYFPSPATARDGQTPDDPLNSRTCPRRFLVELARTHPEKRLDFGLVNRENPILNPKTPGIDDEAWYKDTVPMRDHVKYKYLVNADGLGTSGRFEELLALGSVVLHAASAQDVHFFTALIPFFHYVPIMRAAVDDIFPIMEWLDAHPAVAKSIAANGQAFACRHLRKRARHKHWRTVFSTTRDLLDYQPDSSRRPHMMQVRPEDLNCEHVSMISGVKSQETFGCKFEAGQEALKKSEQTRDENRAMHAAVFHG